MEQCFVMQPFDAAEFDRRYDEIYKEAITAAGFTPYRVDRDPGASIPINAIEMGIRRSSVCFIDISVDNPNVWFEFGYAICAQKPICIVCSTERTEFPFDVQHRQIIRYKTSSPSDFQKLKESITNRMRAMRAEIKVIAIKDENTSSTNWDRAARIRMNVQTAAAELDALAKAIETMPVLHSAGACLARAIMRHLPPDFDGNFNYKDFRVFLPTVIAEAIESNQPARNVEALTARLQHTLTILATDVPAFAILAGNFSEIISSTVGFNAYTNATRAEVMPRIMRIIKSKLKNKKFANIPLEYHLIAAFTGQIVQIYSQYYKHMIDFSR